MIETIIAGGSMMIPLVACSVVALAVLLERGVAFYANSRIDTRALRAQVVAFLEEDRLNDAMTLCASTPGPISAVILAGIQSLAKMRKIRAAPDTVRAIVGKCLEDYAAHAISAVEKRLNVLSTIGNAAPLLGMTGTVTGMIASFGALAGAGALDAGAVGAGIAEALITTAAGLLIALGAVIPYNYFMAQSEGIGLEIEEASAELLDFVSLHEARACPAP
ncbi:MAG: MotA/TolQ/ExbB proton channel family protein [Lentisphaerae bacterium]|nr:MotA/TolQ/ExbB proton channel family protein [Lentisphaerota bacterium]